MNAIVFSEPGPPDVLHLAEVEDPEAGSGQVRVRVRAAGVQPADLAVRQGWAPPGTALRLPLTPGNEFAGTVDQVGDRAHGFTVGSDVLGFTTLGSYAELIAVDADHVVAKPGPMPWEVAGALSASGQTAHTALEDLAAGPGDTLLVHAAGGGVGSMAVQLARHRGATVIGTGSEASHAHLRSLGAVPVAYGEGLAERVRALAPDGVDAALDAAGGDALSVSVELVDDRERIGTLVDFGGAGRLGVRALRSRPSASRLAELVDLHGRGVLRVPIWRTFPMADAAAAHREVATRHTRGKVVLLVASNGSRA